MKRRIMIEDLPKDAKVTKEEMKNVTGRGAVGVGNPGSSPGTRKFFDVFTIVADDHAFIRR